MTLYISLTCIPTLLPLFTYFRKGKKSKGYNLEDSSGNNLGSKRGTALKFLKSSTQIQVTSMNQKKTEWKYSDSIGNNSQKKILEIQSSVVENGIAKTTQVDVAVSQATEEDQNLRIMRGFRLNQNGSDGESPPVSCFYQFFSNLPAK